MLRCNTMVSFSFKYFAAMQTIIIMLEFLSSTCPPAPHTINFNPHLLWRIFDALYFQNKYFFLDLKQKEKTLLQQKLLRPLPHNRHKIPNPIISWPLRIINKIFHPLQELPSILPFNKITLKRQNIFCRFQGNAILHFAVCHPSFHPDYISGASIIGL